MFTFGIIPDPQTALEQTPDTPTSSQVLRLAEALYYASQYWQYPYGGRAAYFDQLSDVFQARYYRLARYLARRRQRPGARPVDVAAIEQRALTFLTDTAWGQSFMLWQHPASNCTVDSVATFLTQYYPGWSREQRTRLATAWLAQLPVEEPLPF